ncbi:MAG: lipid-A-disaccharide synthase [Chitinophagaceae bacterium]|nr:lipid-A-disaccharide synthase [Chitinophagaceae bacterium]
MKYYIIAGEASGDLHGSNLIREIKKLDNIADVRGWGGDLMQEAGARLAKHYKDIAFMGFIEVIKNINTIFRNLAFCKADISTYKPDALILIDYPGFNLRIAEWAKKKGIKVIYYISPQVWAWKENRVKQIRKNIDKMLVILPFEKEFYNKWKYEVEYVGHPLAEVVDNAQSSIDTTVLLSPLNENNIIALLPGSREQEVAKKLPVMLDVSRDFPDYKFIIAKAPSLDDSFYDQFTSQYKNVRSLRNKTYPLLMQSKAALVTSGTATLETALFGVPQVVCYKGSAISYQIAKRLLKVKYISLVNLIMDKPVVKELIQNEMTALNIRTELTKILKDPATIMQMKKDYAALKKLLGEGGNASEKAAKSIVGFVKEGVTKVAKVYS